MDLKTIDQLRQKDKSSNPINISEWYKYVLVLYTEKNEDISISDLENISNSKTELDYSFSCKEIKIL